MEAGPDDKKPNFADILAFLNPTEETLKQLVMEATTSQPKLLSQLLAADLPSLLRTFQQLLLQSHTLEGAYRALLTGVGEEGVEAYMDRWYMAHSNVLHTQMYSTLNCTAHSNALHTQMHCTLKCTVHSKALQAQKHCKLKCTAHSNALQTHMHCTTKHCTLNTVYCTTLLTEHYTLNYIAQYFTVLHCQLATVF